MFRKALGAIATLQQESLASSDLGELTLQLARLTSKNERGKTGKLTLDISKGRLIRKDGRLLDGL